MESNLKLLSRVLTPGSRCITAGPLSFWERVRVRGITTARHRLLACGDWNDIRPAFRRFATGFDRHRSLETLKP
jgi:hypothetical protein